MSDETKQTIVTFAINELTSIIDNWCDLDVSGGEMRECRGTNIEEFVLKIIHKIAKILDIDLVAKKGKFDKKKLVLPDNNQISKLHQVDIHIYLNKLFVAVIECKSYLDSCYYVRACDDFELFKKFGYHIKSVIFSLENSIDDNTKKFTDYVKDGICHHVFYMLDGKRSSSKPIYQKEYRKYPTKEKMESFISFLYNLII